MTNDKLASNIVLFAQALRRAGIKLGPQSIKSAIDAVVLTGIDERLKVYQALKATLTQRREDHAVYDAAFALFWRKGGFETELINVLSPRAATSTAHSQDVGLRRALDALRNTRQGKDPDPTQSEDVVARLQASSSEALQTMDFAQMSADELKQARRMIAKLRFSDDRVATRRFRPARDGKKFDGRRTMRSAVRAGGQVILPKMRTQRTQAPPLVLIADVSGSMSQYSRMFLTFFHTLSAKRDCHSFVFATRLTNLTHAMKHKDPDLALQQCASSVSDWSGGTRIGSCLHTFNRHWARRVLGRRARVLLITDGLEREDPTRLAKACERLSKSCDRLIWLNPLLRFEGFEPLAGGVKAMLPYIDEFRPIHNIVSMASLCEALEATRFKARAKIVAGAIA